MADTKKYVLGTAYEGYTSETVVDMPKADIRSGLVVAKNTEGLPVEVGANVPYGISGQNVFQVNTPVHIRGLKVCTRLAVGESPAIGTAAYAKEDGTITTTKDGNIALAATFASEKVIGIDLQDNSEADAVLLDFAGGI